MISVVIIFILGLSIVLLIDKLTKNKTPIYLSLILSFLIGSVVAVFILFVTSFIFDIWNSSIIISALAVFLLLISLYIRQELYELYFKVISYCKQFKNVELMILMGIVILIIYFISSIQLHNSFLHSDAMSFWFVKANIFYQDQTLNIQHLFYPTFQTHLPLDPKYDDINLSQFSFIVPNYPLFTPLLITWVYIIEGSKNVIMAKSLWLFLELSLLLLLFITGKQTLRNQKFSGLIPIFIYYGIPAIAWRFTVHNFGFADIWLGTYLFASLFLIYSWMNEKKTSYLFLAGIIISGLGFIRIEGIIILAFIPLILFFKGVHYQINKKIITILISLMFFVAWKFITIHYSSENSYQDYMINSLFNYHRTINRFWGVLWITFKYLLNFKKFLIIWPIWIISIISTMYRKKIDWNILGFNGIVMIGIGILIAHYIAAPYDIEHLVLISVDRYFGEFLPAVIFLTMINIQYFLSK